MDIEYNFSNIKELSITGFSIKLTDYQSENYSLIRKLWMKFNKELHNCKLHDEYIKSWIKYGVTFKYNGLNKYLAGIESKYFLTQLLKSENTVIPANRYACFIHKGKLSNIAKTIHIIYRQMIPQKNINRIEPQKSGIIHFEKYDNRFHWSKESSEIDILVPVLTE